MKGTQLFDLKGKVAVVTGASSGLGRGAATVLAAHGVKIVAIAPVSYTHLRAHET